MSENTKQKIDRVYLNKLKWRSRRGMLENDLLLQKFFQKHENQLNYELADAFTKLMNLADADLFDLLLGKKDLTGELDEPAVRRVLQLLQE